MMKLDIVIIYEFLGFGLDHLAKACVTNNIKPVLFVESTNSYKETHLQDIEVVVIDTRNPKLIIEYITKNYLLSSIKGLINSTDTFSLFGAEVAIYFNLISNSLDTLVNIRNKDLLRIICSKLKLTNIKSQRIYDFTDLEKFYKNLDKPIILKNSNGTGSQDIFKISNFEELDIIRYLFSDSNKNWIAEEFIYGVLYSVESISYKGIHQLVGVTSRTLSHEPLFQETSCSFPAVLPQDIITTIEEYSSKLLTGLNFLHGYTHIEFMLKNNEPILIEVNPRLGGGLIGKMMSEALSTNIYENMLYSSIGYNPYFKDLHFKLGASFTVLYATQKGKISSVNGLDTVKYFSDSFYYPVKQIGDQIEFIYDQRASYGMVMSTDINTQMAFYKANTISNFISVTLE